MSELFRGEAIDYRKKRLEGEALITRPVSTLIVTILITAVTATLLLWATLGRYTRTETVPGSLVTDGVLAKVYAERPGQLIWLGVRDGDLVRQGQPIATIRTEEALEGGASPDIQRLSSMEEQEKLIGSELSYENDRARQERLRLSKLIKDLSLERSQLTSGVDLQRRAVASTRDSFEALTSIVTKGFETRTMYEQRRQAWLGASTQLQTLVVQITQIEERLSEAKSDLAKLPGDHAAKTADLRNSLDQLDQRRVDVKAARAFTITAPISGRVTALQTLAGRSTDIRLPLLAILPIGALMQADLYAPSRAVGMAKIGQEVRLMYDAFPYQRFGTSTGRIIRISRSVLAPDEVDAPIKLQEPIYRIRVALDRQTVNAFGQPLPLEPGMALTADVVLDRRSFLDWVLEPIRAVKARA